ncbi:MAG: transposase [Pirellulaceae bacterium]
MDELNLTVRKLLEGKRREKFPWTVQQLALEFPDDPELQEALQQAKAEAAGITEEITVKRTKRRKQKKGDEKFPDHLRREFVDALAADSERYCSEHGERKIIRYDEVETLVLKRPELFVRVTRYPIFACAGQPQCGLKSPERPVGIVEGDRYDASLAVAIANNKFGYYLPYYRMQDIFASSGWTPSRSTLDNIIDGLEFIVQPLIELMWQRVLSDLGVGIDDTNVTLLMPNAIPEVKQDDTPEQQLKTRRLIDKMLEAQKKGEASLNAKMWVYSGLVNQPYNLFDFRVSRHRDGPAEVLRDYGGHVMADCYSGNLSVILGWVDDDSHGLLVVCARHMHEARINFAKETALPLALMAQLYDIERRAVDYTAEQRYELRQQASVMILARLRQWLDGPIAGDALPKSKLGKAINYLRNHWQSLQEFTLDGRLPIDNNPVEALMKQIATGRKNWLFLGSVRAGERNAKLMSLVSSAHRQDLDVEMYLDDIVRSILTGSTDYESMLPDNWRKSHPSAIRNYRQEERRDQADRSRFQAAKRRQLLETP